VDPAGRERLSEDEYLARERASETKHEYVNGELVAMAGASRRHNLIAANVAASLASRLRDRPCVVLASDQRVAISRTRLYAYPDVTVVCGRPESHPKDPETIVNSTVLIEVLSEATERYDRGAKFAHYQRLESLRHYLMISQSERRVEHYARLPSGQWLLTVQEEDGAIPLEALGVDLPLEEVFAKLDLLG
jgi:Uma2 family endonuclease